MKKTYTLILLIIAVGFLVGCTIISTSNEDHEQLSERLLELDLEQKDYYQVNIEVTTAIAFDRYFYMYVFDDVAQTYHSTYRVNETEYDYKYSEGIASKKVTNNNVVIEEETEELSFEEFQNQFVSLFGSRYNVDLMEAAYKREETVFSFSNNSYLKNHFVFNREYEFFVSLFELEIVVTDIVVEFGSIKNENNTTLFDNFTIRGITNVNNKVTINIHQ
ncbi:hypothetical protein [Acholeplasma laidlawii]|uniref:hypothetical protein n=1 Tax=Acholeplasma laidlawii TaxID=2148 RepID=UPI003F8F74FC